MKIVNLILGEQRPNGSSKAEVYCSFSLTEADVMFLDFTFGGTNLPEEEKTVTYCSSLYFRSSHEGPRECLRSFLFHGQKKTTVTQCFKFNFPQILLNLSRKSHNSNRAECTWMLSEFDLSEGIEGTLTILSSLWVNYY